MKPIFIQEVAKKNMRYDTVGDYFMADDLVCIEVCKEKGYVKNEDELIAVVIHELIEFFLVNKRKIKISDIDKWDTDYKGNGEPGEVKGAPYFREHAFANRVEALFLKELKKSI